MFRQKFIFIFLITLFLLVSAIAFFLWQKVKKFEPEVYYYVPPETSFIYNEEEFKYGLEKYLREAIETEMAKLIKNKESFIYANLKNMELALYKEGEKLRVFPVQGKGAEWFWGETPAGIYSVGFKSRLHFSTAARVWMPYAIQYYGNYFIHGWPYDRAGRLLSPGPSGGCIRLNTQEAAAVFEFAQLGMPILVFDERIPRVLPAIASNKAEIISPETNAQFLLAADLDTGEILLSKEADSEIFAGPAVYGMLALVASDAVNLDKRIVARDWMTAGVGEKIIVPGRTYKGYDLLKPLLLQSSKEAALVLSRFITAEKFVDLMNEKTKGIGMKNTVFADVVGAAKENTTTLFDVARMMRYIKDYRKFILNISNELSGRAENETKSIFLTQEMKAFSDDASRFIFIGIVNSFDPKEDLKNINEWLENNFSLKKI